MQDRGALTCMGWQRNGAAATALAARWHLAPMPHTIFLCVTTEMSSPNEHPLPHATLMKVETQLRLETPGK